MANASIAADKGKDFSQWLADFKQYAIKEGVSQKTADAALDGIKFRKKIVRADKNQPEKKYLFDNYNTRSMSHYRMFNGRKHLEENAELLDEISAKYKVQKEFIVALWGVETAFGTYTGNLYIPEALATLAFEGRRAKFFGKELLLALKIIDAGHIKAVDMIGSWAGAMGQTQFMPSSFLAYAVDYNKDGKKDTWHTRDDVFASIANYLKNTGWKQGDRFIYEVRVPSKKVAIANYKKKHSLKQWNKLGFVRPHIGKLPNSTRKMQLILPDKKDNPTGRAFLVNKNFDNLMKWNRSTYFGITVMLLADSYLHQNEFFVPDSLKKPKR